MPLKEKIIVEDVHLMPSSEPSWASLGMHGLSNLVVMICQVIAWLGFLTIINDPSYHLLIRAIALVLFCLMMQGVFTMLHEFCHGNAHQNKKLNYMIGWVTSTLFGTSPTLLQIQHWGHHRRNRTESERAEFIHEGETSWVKIIQYYFSILGGIWLACFLFSILSPLLPFSTIQKLSKDKRFVTFAAGFTEFSVHGWRRMQIEGLVLLMVIVSLLYFGPWSGQTLVIAYASFAFTWSSLQWVYHLHTPIHVVEGAYNLRAPWLVTFLFLNFNYNLTHHRHPSLPWQKLKAESDQNETQPLWYRYLLIFRAPVVFPEDTSVLMKKYF